MAATEVVQIIAWLEAAGVIYQINGGWGVDGLVGRQTRRGIVKSCGWVD